MIRVGTSGWLYPPWRGRFYPTGLPQRRELEYLAERLNSVEINGSFYALQRPSSYQRWSEHTPDDFIFAVKGPRYVTHMKRLVDVEQPLATFLASGVLALGPKLGPLLWQLPPQLPYRPDPLRRFVDLLPDDTATAAQLASGHHPRIAERAWLHIDANRPLRHAFEVRHPSFAHPDFAKLLRDNNIALVLADTAGRFPVFDEHTADFAYIRLHGDAELYASRYSDAALDRWAQLLRGRADAYVYFDNDVHAHAPHDAMRLAQRLRPAAQNPTGTPRGS